MHITLKWLNSTPDLPSNPERSSAKGDEGEAKDSRQ